MRRETLYAVDKQKFFTRVTIAMLAIETTLMIVFIGFLAMIETNQTAAFNFFFKDNATE